jgi:UDP-N-acetylglucosamine acyltransferase
MQDTTDFYNSEWINLDGNWIHKTAIVHNNVKLGKGNTIGAYAVIGGNGEIRGVKQGAFKGTVVIGDNNVISELVTIQRPFTDTCTKIGNNNLIMAHSHIGHDVQIGDDCEICTGTILGGYAIIENKVKLKLGVTVRNRKKIESGALVGLGSVVVKDIASGETVVGNPAKQLKK